MREIKFRAWSDINKKMLYSESKTDEYYNGAFLLWGERVGNFWRLGDADHEWYIDGASNSNDGTESKDVLMQFTGLFDKNGKEIYEGDILKIGNSNIEVIWDKNNAWFTLKSNHFHLGFQSIFYEVIGNIYEHSHLLESEEK